MEIKIQENKKLKTISEQKKFGAYDIWERFGMTKHLGSIYATRQLIKLYNITPGQYILDIGCGTGYTACLLAKEYQVDVVAADITSRVLEVAKKRIIKENVGNKVTTIEGDAHKLPFPSNTFDAVIAESVLAFCDKTKVSSEVYRVLKPDGIFGDNEATYLKLPPAQLTSWLSKSSLGIDVQLLQQDEWQAVYREAGFEDVSSTVYPIKFRHEFSNLRVYGIRRYLSALVQSIFDPSIRRTFFKKDMLKAMRQFSSCVGYGLYVSRKV